MKSFVSRVVPVVIAFAVGFMVCWVLKDSRTIPSHSARHEDRFIQIDKEALRTNRAIHFQESIPSIEDGELKTRSNIIILRPQEIVSISDDNDFIKRPLHPKSGRRYILSIPCDQGTAQFVYDSPESK